MPVLTRQRLVRRAARSASAAAARAVAIAASRPPVDIADPAAEHAPTSTDPGGHAGPGNTETTS
jgi:hypothetical protein